jgi:hypothetical protein
VKILQSDGQSLALWSGGHRRVTTCCCGMSQVSLAHETHKLHSCFFCPPQRADGLIWNQTEYGSMEVHNYPWEHCENLHLSPLYCVSPTRCERHHHSASPFRTFIP